MDKDRVEGSLKQAGGAIKENLGAAVGDKKMEAEGAAKRAEGKVQNAAGGVKDAVRDAADKA
ncbi:CsbD family protein [Roseomonas sp. SG15]|uniref:CsbD family protein n=1 Tax=Roseomonas indoligenes TaxID=2820811 RepID=A0A940N1F2_9PROT|nr:CsbD family protein [Pararoseomonas indoligenes]